MARTVPLKLNYASRSGLVKGPQYTIQEDPPWLQQPPLSPSSPPAEPRPSSTYSEDRDMAAAMEEAGSPSSSLPLSLQKSNSPDALVPRHGVVDDGSSQSKTSRLPIFKQVRSMLNSARSPTTPAGALKWDEYSGEPSENGKERLGVKPSTYKSPYEGILRPRRQSNPQSPDEQESPRMVSAARFSPERTEEHLDSPVMDNNARRLSPAGIAGAHQTRAISPVSALVEDDMHMLAQQTSRTTISPPNSRSVSPIMTYDQVYQQPYAVQQTEDPSSVMQRPRTEGNGSAARVKRKPVAPTPSQQFDSFPPTAEPRIKPNSSHGAALQTLDDDPSSRFSWTTAAQSEAPRKSTDTRYSRPPKTADESDRPHDSHFSWSTMASTAPIAHLAREQTPPPSPPPVPMQYLEPPVYGTPPTQSILSRHRPFKRVDLPEWAPPPPPVPHTSRSLTPRALTPKVYRIQDDYAISTTPTAEGKKRLPLPPLFTEKSLSHLEGLLTREKNIVMQRRNIERSIVDLEKVEKASPLEVSFAAVREAKKKLDERRGVLDEIRKEEMDIGIRIARARRKEDFGDGEGTLWVRRVTG